MFAMARAKQSDNFAAYILITVVCAVICVAMMWMYFDYKQRTASYLAYSDFGPIVARGADFSIRASVALQTRNEDTSWVEKNKKAVNTALQAALASADPARVRTPGGLTYVQEMLRDAVNASLGTQNVQDILLTDFIIQTN
jgi:flagellar basal body-associated protein FliL